MAITQTRMLALIKIADDFKDQLLFFNRTISSAIRDLPPAPTFDELLATIQSVQNICNTMSINPNALEILATEKAHFKQNATRNSRMAMKARLKRSGGDDRSLEAIPPRHTAPASIARHIPAGYETFFQKSTASAIHTTPQQQTEIYSGVAAPYSKIGKVEILSDEQLNKLTDMKLAAHKQEINAFCASHKMPPAYPDPYDDSIPLANEHKRHLGLPVDDDDASPF